MKSLREYIEIVESDNLAREELATPRFDEPEAAWDYDDYVNDTSLKISPDHIQDSIQTYGHYKTAKAIQKLHDADRITTDEAKKHLGYINSHKHRDTNDYSIDDTRLRTADVDVNELDYSSFTSSDELQHLRDAIDKNIVVSVAFVKKDGTVKHMAIKKNLSAYVPSTREKTDRQLNVEQNNDIKKVVDINAYIRKLKELKAAGMEEAQAKAEAAKGAWRSINLKNVLGFMVKGQFIDLRDENEIQQRFGDEIYNSVTPAMQSALAQSQQAMESIEEAKGGADNFTADDIHELEKMDDIDLIKDRAIELIMTPSKKPMKPEKVSYFKNKIEMMKSKMDIIKLMYDLLLSGEGFGVVGSRNSMSSNSYRQRFGENESDEVASLKELADQLDELSPKTLSSYAKKSLDTSGNDKSIANLASRAASKLAADDDDDGMADDRKAVNRSKGVDRAIDRLAKLAGL